MVGDGDWATTGGRWSKEWVQAFWGGGHVREDGERWWPAAVVGSTKAVFGTFPKLQQSEHESSKKSGGGNDGTCASRAVEGVTVSSMQASEQRRGCLLLSTAFQPGNNRTGG